MNERPVSGSGEGGFNVHLWVKAARERSCVQADGRFDAACLGHAFNWS